MPPIETIDSNSSEQSTNNWYLVTVRSKKREVFLKYLNLAISQNQLQDLVIEIKSPQDAVYQDIV
ncbi:MAG: chromosome segregation ATPase, partial [Dolichospermum sp.]